MVKGPKLTLADAALVLDRDLTTGSLVGSADVALLRDSLVDVGPGFELLVQVDALERARQALPGRAAPVVVHRLPGVYVSEHAGPGVWVAAPARVALVRGITRGLSIRGRMRLPVLGTVRLPEPQRLTYYAAVGALGVLGMLEWPVALVLAGGHALAADQHNRAVQQFGEALEDA